MNSSRAQRAFTLVELVVAIAISSVVVVFASMFISAPLGAFEAQSRRAVLVGDVSAAWPRMLPDLREALPNSLRTRRNGSFVVIEMLTVQGVARYMTALGSPFDASGTGGPQGSLFSNTPAALTNDSRFHLSVNNRGIAGRDAYALSGSMTPTRPGLTFVTGINGEGSVTVTPAPALTAGDSPRRRVYLVKEAVTYLCDETQGTLRRYSGYAIAANQTARDAPNEFGGALNMLIARGLTRCDFSVSPVDSDQPQTFAARLTATLNGESVTLLHSSRAEYAP
jgi:prepilin-type N-terminal cleavage/methylation domain-containing protein